MFLSISRADFADLEGKLNKAVADHNNQIKNYTATSDTSGVITTRDVTVEYSFDPNAERLTVAVGKRHSLAAKIAPLQVIETHIIELIHNLEPADKPEIEPEPEPKTQVVFSKPVVKPVVPVVNKPKEK
jgi:hypothetical protein